jgi:hypothetical protein
MKRDGRDIAAAFASRTTMSKRNKAIFPDDFDPFFIGRPDLLLTRGGACKLKLLDNVKVHGKVLSR